MTAEPGRPLVAVPLLAERLALGRRLPAVVRVGRGPARAAAAAATVRSVLDAGGYAGLLVAGTCGGLTDRLRPGDLVVASEVHGAGTLVRCAGAAELAAALRAAGRFGRSGRTVHIGPIYTADHLVDGAERAVLAGTGALAVDTESALLAAAAGDRPVLVVRAVSDTPRHPLRSVGIVRGGLSALRSLRAAAPVLADWTMTPDVPAGERPAPKSPDPHHPHDSLDPHHLLDPYDSHDPHDRPARSQKEVS
jgi:4-hydroxy-3-methylbut-2-enyl diphosphate reductase